jgi:hypothetical protein
MALIVASTIRPPDICAYSAAYRREAALLLQCDTLLLENLTAFRCNLCAFGYFRRPSNVPGI